MVFHLTSKMEEKLQVLEQEMSNLDKRIKKKKSEVNVFEDAVKQCEKKLCILSDKSSTNYNSAAERRRRKCYHSESVNLTALKAALSDKKQEYNRIANERTLCKAKLDKLKKKLESQ